jgi:hypothetical protein
MNLLGHIAPDTNLDVQLCEPVVSTPDGLVCLVVDGALLPICEGQAVAECDSLVQRAVVQHTLCRPPSPAPWLSRRVVDELRRAGVDDPVEDARDAVCAGVWTGWRRAMTKALCRSSRTLLCAGKPGDAAGAAYAGMLMAPKDEASGQHVPESRPMLDSMVAYLRASDREWQRDDPSGSDRAFASVCRKFCVSPGSALAVKVAVRGGRHVLGDDVAAE